MIKNISERFRDMLEALVEEQVLVRYEDVINERDGFEMELARKLVREGTDYVKGPYRIAHPNSFIPSNSALMKAKAEWEYEKMKNNQMAHDDLKERIRHNNAIQTVQSIGWSKFARHRHQEGMGFSYFSGHDVELISIIHENWDKRVIGDGADSIDDVCVVPVTHPMDIGKFICTTVPVQKDMNLNAKVTRRQPNEHYFVKVESGDDPVCTKFAKVVLYASHELLKNGGKRSTDCDWEIVCIIASPVEKEPMHPLACARNMLGKPGGTPRTYTAQEFAESIWYWSQYVSLKATKETEVPE